MSQPPPVVPSGEMEAAEFRRLSREVADWITTYLSEVGDLPVLPEIEPGSLRAAFPADPPQRGEPLDDVLDDFRSLVVPANTHWGHPAFFAYFASSGSGPGILGEMLAAALNVNAMIWRSAPAATELEGLTMDWLAKLVGLPPTFEGVINDTASSSTLYALTAAREQAWPQAHREGLFGLAPGRVYASEHAHSSVEKAVLVLGLGRDGYRPVAADDEFRMDPAALRTALEEDRARGARPVAVVATLGTTSSGALDPVGQIADVAAEFDTWLHVDAAYGGPAAMLPELEHHFRGWERADSLVLNPHKWLFTPLDCSALYCGKPDVLKRAFSIVPEYLRTAETGRARDLMDYGTSMGRRFRALKLWFVLRWFGREGLQQVLRGHLALATWLAGRVRETPGWELSAPVHLGLVCLRHVPAGASDDEVDDINARIMARVNRSGEAFLSHTRLQGRFVIRVAIGSVRTTNAHVARVWELLRGALEEEARPSRAGGG